MKPSLILITIFIIGISTKANAEEWKTTGAVYLWGAGEKGEVATLPGVPPAEIDIEFSDILDNLEMAFMGILDMRKGDWAVLTEILYLDVESDDLKTSGPLFDGGAFDQQLLSYAMAISRRYMFGDTVVDPYVGYRYWDLTNELKLDAGVLSATSIDESESWGDLFVGARAQTPITKNWYLAGLFATNVAGDSDSFLDLYAGVKYNLSDTSHLIIGYRQLEVDYDNDDFLFDVELSGPAVGAIFNF